MVEVGRCSGQSQLGFADYGGKSRNNQTKNNTEHYMFVIYIEIHLETRFASLPWTVLLLFQSDLTPLVSPFQSAPPTLEPPSDLPLTSH